MSTRAQRFFQSYAVDFDAIYGTRGLISGIPNRLFRKSMVLRFVGTLAQCKPIEGASVLDVGCGPGHYCVALARAGAAHCLGVDFAPGMLQLANARAAAGGVGDRCTFRELDIMNLDESEQFDFVIAMGLMDYILDPIPLIAKLARLANRKVLISFPADGGVLAWQRKLRYRSRCELHLYDELEVRRLLAGVQDFGYTVERISRDFFGVLERGSQRR